MGPAITSKIEESTESAITSTEIETEPVYRSTKISCEGGLTLEEGKIFRNL